VQHPRSVAVQGCGRKWCTVTGGRSGSPEAAGGCPTRWRQANTPDSAAREIRPSKEAAHVIGVRHRGLVGGVRRKETEQGGKEKRARSARPFGGSSWPAALCRPA
jgi:hypothetical protein